MATFARNIWLRKNTMIFGGVLTHPSQLICSAKEALEYFYRTVRKEMSNEEQEQIA